MYRFWEPVVEPLLVVLKPKMILEIGSDQGFNTRNLVDFSRRTGATLHVIDPMPKFDTDEWLKQYPDKLVFHLAPSLEVLVSTKRPDVVLIDGDHNWHTVFNELKLLEESVGDGPDQFPFVFLHDVGWPYGRRDLYYEPDRIPSPDRHPHRKEGIRPGREGLDPEGGLNPHLYNALHEGGPRNGVLTAVEDFIRESSLEFEFVVVPGINDLGILCLSSLYSERPAVMEFVDGLDDALPMRRLLERVERLRIEAQIDSADRERENDRLRLFMAERDSRLARREAKLVELESRAKSAEKTRDLAAAQTAQVRAELDFHKESAQEREAIEKAERKQVKAERSKAISNELAMKKAQADLKSVRKQLVSSKKRLTVSEKRLTVSEKRYRRLRSRKSVRLALRLAEFARPFIRLLRGPGGTPSVDGSSGTKTSDERSSARTASHRRAESRLAKKLVEQRPGSPLTTGPTVSIVILTRDGAEHLKLLLRKLDEVTRYRSFEVIVVDNGSTDETAELLEVGRGFPLKVVSNNRNTSFSEGNNQGVKLAKGELILFLNNDIEPINPGWLGAMVEVPQTDDNIVAVGAELVYPARGIPESDLTVQHCGIRFTFRDQAVWAVNINAPDPLEDRLARTVEFPAATAAALLVRADSFRSVGGFDRGYVYGTEDVDLCLKLGELGRIVVTGQAVLFHNESATQTKTAAEITRINRRGNRQRLAEHWGPRLTRSVRRDRLMGVGQWTTKVTRTVAITLSHDDISQGWGDYYTAHELGDVFAAAGWRVVYAERYQDHWYEIDQEVDLLISLLDSFDVGQAPDGAFTIAWVRNWVDRWLEQPWFESFDVVAATSHKAARLISDRSRYESAVVPLATNPERFHTGPPHPTFKADYAFTGNNWGPGREVIKFLDVHPDEIFMLFGKGWDRDPRVERYWRGSLSYELLPEVYRSTKVVLDDTAEPTLPYAFVNGRVFDALAAGALVLTDNIEGSQEMFEGMLPTYSNREELRAQLDHWLLNEDERTALVEKLRHRVSINHSYAARPAEFLKLALDYIERPRAAIKIAVPDHEVKPNWGDTHFGGALASALTELGMPTEVHLLPEWDLPAKQEVDVVIHLRGLTSYAPKPAHINVLWIISHPDDVTIRECEKYDLVLVASQQYAEWLRSQTETKVMFMPQATDHRRFHPVEPDSELETEVVFVGNSRGQDRPAVDWAIRQGLPLTVYGGGWDGRIDSGFVRGDHFPNEELANLYGSAKVVLNDHWPDMRDHGFISNRIFDALASGAVVVSDPVAGLEQMFGDLVPTYSDPEELEGIVRGLLEDHDRRKKIVHSAAALVAEEHTFSRRGQQLMALLRPLISERKKDLEGGVFE